MLELVFIGRGGQGAKTAAQFIAEAALGSGSYVQAFPEFGPERMGAPVRAFVRISEKPIRTHAPVIKPNVVVLIDPTLMRHFDVAQGMGSQGTLIINSPKNPDELRKELKFPGRVYAVDATKISIELVGANLPNTPMLGALLRVTGIVSMESLVTQLKAKFMKKIGEEKTNANIGAVKRAFSAVR